MQHFRDIGDFLKACRSGEVEADGLILATPTQTHVALTKLLEGSGLSVLIEKPLSATGDDGKDLLEVSNRDTKGVYMVGHHRRHNAYVKGIKDVLDKNKLGHIVAINGGGFEIQYRWLLL